MASYKNSYNARIVLFAALGCLTYGYTGGTLSTTVGQPSFFSQMSLDGTSQAEQNHKNVMIGAMNSVYATGAAVGALFILWLPDKFGRKLSLQIAAVFCIVGGVLQSTSYELAQFIVGRFFSGWGISMLLTLVPIYESEVAHTSGRGWIIGHTGIFLTIGFFLACFVAFGCYYAMNAQFSWRLPIALQIVPALPLLLFGRAMPESPRWLILKERHDEAFEILRKLHYDENDPEEMAARQELAQISQQLALEVQELRDSPYRFPLIQKPANRKRFIICFFLLFMAQFSGIQVITTYNPVLFADLGVTGGIPLLLNAVYNIVAFTGNTLSAAVIDKLGRIRSMLIGIPLYMIVLSCEAAMVAKYEGTSNKIGNIFGVFFIYVFIACWATFVDNVVYIYPPEILPIEIRAKGMAVAIFAQWVGCIILFQVGALGFANLKWKFYLIFVGLSVIFWLFVKFYCPETMGMSLEEVRRQFGEEVVLVEDKLEEKVKATTVLHEEISS